MRLAVLTDTHVGSMQELPGPMLKALADVDLIVHAGDFTETTMWTSSSSAIPTRRATSASEVP